MHFNIQKRRGDTSYVSTIGATRLGSHTLVVGLSENYYKKTEIDDIVESLEDVPLEHDYVAEYIAARDNV